MSCQRQAAHLYYSSTYSELSVKLPAVSILRNAEGSCWWQRCAHKCGKRSVHATMQKRANCVNQFKGCMCRESVREREHDVQCCQQAAYICMDLRNFTNESLTRAFHALQHLLSWSISK